MVEGTRFDLQYDTMPWDRVDAVIFDIGNILIQYAPDNFISILFPGDEKKQRDMMAQVYNGPYWLCFDRGTMTYEEAARRLHEEYGYVYEDYMHALMGRIDIKPVMEEGFRAARRCRAAGKKLYLLSNYPQVGYERMREKFAAYFGDLFDGGVISCYVHQLKPDAEIYHTLMERYGFAADRAVFIDDTLKNVEGAMKVGIHGFHMHEKGMLDRFFI